MAEAVRSERNGAVPLRPNDLDAYFASFEVGVDPFLRAERVPVIAPHAEATRYAAQALAHRLRGPDAEVGDDLPVDFTVADRCGAAHRNRLHPDVFVSLGVAHDPVRNEYDADELGAPDFVLEVLSRSTWQRDVGEKRAAYAALGVREYFLFDPTGELPVQSPLQGFDLADGGRRLSEQALPNGRRGVPSEVLGLVAYVAEQHVVVAEGRSASVLSMRWHDPDAGVDIPTYGEQAEARAAAEARAERETTAREAAEARAEREAADREAAERERMELLALVRRLRGGPEAVR